MEHSIVEMQRQIGNVLDRESIRQLVIVYCHHVRKKNMDGILASFAKDASFELPANVAATHTSGGLLEGKAAVAEMYRSNLKKKDLWPFTHNHVVEMQGGGRERARRIPRAEANASDAAIDTRAPAGCASPTILGLDCLTDEEFFHGEW